MGDRFLNGVPDAARVDPDVAAYGIEHVDRGYEQIEAKLVALGANINRIEA